MTKGRLRKILWEEQLHFVHTDHGWMRTAGGPPAPAPEEPKPRRTRNLSAEERERRREQMRVLWRHKKTGEGDDSHTPSASPGFEQ